MKVSWKVDKIKCEGCAEAIAKALLLVDGLQDLTVDPQTKEVAFEADGPECVNAARRALVAAGYPPK